jgi:hypothetical protein
MMTAGELTRGAGCGAVVMGEQPWEEQKEVRCDGREIGRKEEDLRRKMSVYGKRRWGDVDRSPQCGVHATPLAHITSRV